MSEASTMTRYCVWCQIISMLSQKGFDTACTCVWVPTCSPSLFLLKSGANYAPPHPGRTVVVLSVGQMPSLGSRPRRYLAGPYHAFPDGHSGLCGSLKTQPGWLFLGSTAPPLGLVEEIGCALEAIHLSKAHTWSCAWSGIGSSGSWLIF